MLAPRHGHVHTLNEVWGMNPRDSSTARLIRTGISSLNEVWGMNPRDSGGAAEALGEAFGRSTKSGA